MNNQGDQNNSALWLYAILVGLSVQQALVTVVPHALLQPMLEQGAFLPEAIRFLVFLILIIRFYLGSVFYFEEAYFRKEARLIYRRKNYGIDFLFGFVHFVFFFILARSIEIHIGPVEVFQVMLVSILFYDSLWYLASSGTDTRVLIKRWSLLNIITLVLAVGSYTLALYLGASTLLAEEIGIVFVIITSSIDLAKMTAQRRTSDI